MFHFNPRSREGSDGISAYNTTKAAAISIHAPARGATTHSIANSFLKQHFNPRSREGSDSTLSKIFFVIAKFQSTLPRGERLPTCTRDIQTTFISIHAPARGATASVPPTCVGLQFQSTLPRGERPMQLQVSAFLLYHLSPPSLSILFFPIFSIPAPFVHFFRCESPGFFLCTTDSHLKNQHLIYSCTTFYTDMFNFSFIIVSQIIKPKTVFFFIDNVC